MPYIKHDRRLPILVALNKFCEEIGNDENGARIEDMTPGELNFVVTSILQHACAISPSYNQYNEIIGVLECVKQEFYRRAVAVYEDEKRRVNGDVYYK